MVWLGSVSDRHPERRLAVVDELAKLDTETAYRIARRRMEMLSSVNR